MNEMSTKEKHVFKKSGKGYFETEAEGMRRIAEASQGLLRVPEVYSAKDDIGIEMEKLSDLKTGGSGSRTSVQKLARGMRAVHEAPQAEDFRGLFGFPLEGQCGELEHPNNTERKPCDWVEFFSQCRLGYQLQVLRERCPRESEVFEMGSRVITNLREYFEGKGVRRNDIRPSLLHGDLWNGNWGTIERGKTVCVYDPAPFYGHSEFEFGIGMMFGGPCGPVFFDEYYSSPDSMEKAPGFDDRMDLYSLYHHLNHMNIFGAAAYSSGTRRLLHRMVANLKS